MNQVAACPGCGTANKPDASYCQGCGKALLRCPECSSLNSDAVEFCTACGRAMTRDRPSTRKDAGSGGQPYVVWEGFPFAWLCRVSQTRRQYFLYLGIAVSTVAVYFAIFLALAVPAAQSGEEGASEAICLTAFFIVVFVVLFFAAWLVGRRGAEEEEKGRR